MKWNKKKKQLQGICLLSINVNTSKLSIHFEFCHCPVNGHNGKYCRELKHGNNKQNIYATSICCTFKKLIQTK